MITLSDYILEVISKFPFLLLLVQIFRVLYPEYCSFLQLLLPSISSRPSQLTGKCLLSPPWMVLSHYVSMVHQRVSMSHVDSMFGAEALLQTGLDLCLLHSTIKNNQDCNTDILGTSSENTMRLALVTTPTILHFLQDKVQASWMI